MAETQKRVVLHDGYWHVQDNPIAGQPPTGTLRLKGEVIDVTEADVARSPAALGTEDDYRRLTGQEPRELLAAQATTQSVIPTENPSDEAIANMTAAEIQAYLNQHSDDPEEVDRIERIEADKGDAARVTVQKAIETIRSNTAE